MNRHVRLRDAHKAPFRGSFAAFVAKFDKDTVSVMARPPSVGYSLPDDSPSDDDGDSFVGGRFDDVFLRWYRSHFHSHGIPAHANACMFGKWPCKRIRSRDQWITVWDVASRAPLRNIKVARPELRNRYGIGQVVCHPICTYIHNLEGRRIGVGKAVMRGDGGHHVGKHCQYHGIAPQLPSHVRIVYIDVRKIKWCSVGSVAFHSFAWPTFDVRKAESIARTLWTNHCQWADVLVVRGRCWYSNNSYFGCNRVLEHLL